MLEEHEPFCLPVLLPFDVIPLLQAFMSLPAQLCLGQWFSVTVCGSVSSMNDWGGILEM